MRPFIVTILVFGSFLQARSQNSDSLIQSMINRRCKSIIVPILPHSKLNPQAATFNHIEVRDYRSDTFRFGLTTEEPSRQHQLLFNTSASTALSVWLNKWYTQSEQKNHLLVLIKDLWVNEEADFPRQGRHEAWSIRFCFEGYQKQNDAYLPLVRLDTTVYINAKSIVSIEHQVPMILDVFMDKINNLDLPALAGQRRLVTASQIDSFAATRYHFHIETDTVLVKGVYANLDEFRNNQPSVTAYQLTKDKQGMLELQTADANGHYTYTHTAWGLCDGKQSYVMMDGNLFPVFVLHHQFYVLGSKRYSVNDVWLPLYAPLGGGFLTGTTDISESVTRNLRVYPIDLESGRIGR
jgi:hypothetical protein